MLWHFRDLWKRADLLQARLDEANATIARMQAEALDAELPLPKVTATEQLRRRSKAVRRVLDARNSQLESFTCTKQSGAHLSHRHGGTA